jgi:hypothetical protein
MLALLQLVAAAWSSTGTFKFENAVMEGEK